MRVRVACVHPGCDQWADLAWNDEGWWGSYEGDPEESESARIAFDKSLALPTGWSVPDLMPGPLCPEHSP